ncbi:neuraminidase (sialidase)-like protein [bacterium]|nr:neuraminidase (sialidase)-like protein [bacterium]
MVKMYKQTWRILFCITILFCFLSPLTAEEPFYDSSLIFPLESWHNHGSSLVQCPDGSLLACWFHGSGERKADDVKILGARKAKGAKSWSEPFLMADTPSFPDCNPVLFVDPDNQLWLFWITILANRWETSLLKYRTATEYLEPGTPHWDWQDTIHLIPPDTFVDDMLKPWPEFLKEFPQLVPKLKEKLRDELKADEELYYFMKNKVSDKLQQRLGWMTRIHPLVLPSGRMLLPLYTDAFSVGLIAMTDDKGQTWQASRPLVGYGNIQPSLVRKTNGTIVAMMRENGPRNRIRISTSPDDGYTWSDVGEMPFPNPGASVEILRLQNGHWILMYNDTIDGRHKLNLSISADEGETWTWHRHLENEEPDTGSFSYPSIIQARDGMIHATYSYHLPGSKKSIKYVKFNESWVQQGDKE